MNTIRREMIAKSINVLTILALMISTWLLVNTHTVKAVSLAENDISGEINTVNLLASDQNGITLEFIFNSYQIQEGVYDGGVCQNIVAEGLIEKGEPGYPRLPYKGIMLGIPPESEVELSIEAVQKEVLNGKYNLCPTPQPIIETDFTGEVNYQGDIAVKNPEVYSLDKFYPEESVIIGLEGYIRSQRVAELVFSPFQYNPLQGTLIHYSLVRVQVIFKGKSVPEVVVDEGIFEATLQDLLVNYQDARSWREEKTHNLERQTNLTFGETTVYKIGVDRDGMIQVTYEDLVAAGAPVEEISPQTFQLFNNGQEIALLVEDDGDQDFEAGERILFYGTAVDTYFTRTNIYYLTWGLASGKRMQQVDGTPDNSPTPTSFQTTIHLEEEHYYLATKPSGTDNDIWYWDYLYASSAMVSKNFNFQVQYPDTSEGLSARIRGLFKSYNASPHHHTRIYLNGYLIKDATWLPQAEYLFDVEVPQSYLVTGTNTLTVECPFDGGITLDVPLINWFEVSYWRKYEAENDFLIYDGETTGSWVFEINGFTTDQVYVFDITDGSEPNQLKNILIQPGGERGDGESYYSLNAKQDVNPERNFIALTDANLASPAFIKQDLPSNYRSPENQADHLIITYGGFKDQLIPLAEWRRGQGLNSMIIDVEDIYDEFNNGITDSQAIQQFLSYAYQNWRAPAPQYVLLVGDGNYDPRNYLGYGEPTYLPVYLAWGDMWVGYTATDNRFVTVSGDDFLPDMYIGRLPARNAEEVTAMVNKILSYERSHSLDDWTSRITMVADNADGAGNFPYYSDFLVSTFVSWGYSASKIHYTITHTTVDATRAAILDAINQGSLLVNYIGHASIQTWAGETLFGINYLPSLSNSGRLPFIATIGCLAGTFHYPSPPGYNSAGLAESLVRLPDKGAFASWGSTGMGYMSGEDYLSRGLFDAIFNQRVPQVGVATTQAKLYLYASTGSYQDLIDTFTLFGDPASQLQLPQLKAYLPLIVH